MSARAWCIVLGCFFALNAEAAVLYDPALNWRVIMTPRFAVHYSEGERELAVRVGNIAEEELDSVAELFGFHPAGRIEIVLADVADDANGSATILPKNTVRLYMTAPTEIAGLSSYDDWLRMLVIHELAHICDIDQTSGPARVLRWVFGKSVAPNGTAPQFYSEGVAVYAETMLTRTGRGRSSYVAMLLRLAALDRKMLRIDQANVLYADWPGPNVAYFYGGFFHLWLADKFGKEGVRSFHRNSATYPIPYFYSPAAKAAFGEMLPSLWNEWSNQEAKLAEAVRDAIVAEGPLTQARQITHHGRHVTGARYHPNGESIYYSRNSPVDGSTVRSIRRDGTDDHSIALQTLSPSLAVSPSGDAVFYSQSEINDRFYQFNDLYRYDIKKKKITQLEDAESKEPLRARDPDISRDGRSMVFIQNRLHTNRITRATWDDESKGTLKLQTLVSEHGDMQHARPRFSPDGKQLAVSTWFPDGNRDIVILDAQTGAGLQRLSVDDALDANPVWSPDGRYLLYESDLDGVFNIYAFEIQTRKHIRLTHVIGGAFQPDVSPDGAFLLFRNARSEGFDIFEMPFTPAIGVITDRFIPEPGQGFEAFMQFTERLKDDAVVLSQGQTDVSSSVWRTLLPFQHNWLLIPDVLVTVGDVQFGATTWGSDVLAKHRYVLSLGTSAMAQRLNWSVGYFNDVWYPTIAIFGGELATWALDQQTHYAQSSVTWPWRRRHLFKATYNFERRSDLGRPGGRAPGGTNFAWVEASYSYGFSKQYAYSVSLEDGWGIKTGLRGYSKGLGGEFNEILLNLDARGYLNNPWLNNHVLAARAVVAWALGPDYNERFYLGGNVGTSLFSSTTDRLFPLRGFALGSNDFQAGAALLAGYLEYRFPLWQMQRGLWTLPIFLQRLHMALFADAGTAFGRSTDRSVADVARASLTGLKHMNLGVGVEIRADIVLSWAVPLALRAGLGWPIVSAGDISARSPQVYYTVGTMF